MSPFSSKPMIPHPISPSHLLQRVKPAESETKFFVHSGGSSLGCGIAMELRKRRGCQSVVANVIVSLFLYANSIYRHWTQKICCPNMEKTKNHAQKLRFNFKKTILVTNIRQITCRAAFGFRREKVTTTFHKNVYFSRARICKL